MLGVIDYKWTFAKNYPSAEASEEATSRCHERSARRVLKALLANGGTLVLTARLNLELITSLGIFIKLGQHMASL